MIRLSTTFFCVLLALAVTGCDGPATGDSDVTAARRLYSQRKFAEANPLLQRALDKPLRFHRRCEVLTWIGDCYSELENYEDSLAYLDRALEEDPKHHSAYVSKGVVYRLQGEYEKATEMYTKAMEIAPEDAELHASMGALAIFQGDNEAAIKSLELAVQLNDTIAVTHSNLALAYASSGRFDEADRELKKATTQGYHQPELLKERIDRLRNLSNSEE